MAAQMVKTIQILIIAAGTNNAKALYEIQTSHSTPKRIIVARTSELDPSIYFLDHSELNELGIFTDSVIELYEDEWPSDLQPQLTSQGTLPSDFNSSFAQADFGKGKEGIIQMGEYDRTTGSFKAITKTVAGSTLSTEETPVDWYKKPIVKFIGWGALALGALALVVFGMKKLKS